jgi:hypothetical protein
MRAMLPVLVTAADVAVGRGPMPENVASKSPSISARTASRRRG